MTANIIATNFISLFYLHFSLHFSSYISVSLSFLVFDYGIIDMKWKETTRYESVFGFSRFSGPWMWLVEARQSLNICNVTKLSPSDARTMPIPSHWNYFWNWFRSVQLSLWVESSSQALWIEIFYPSLTWNWFNFSSVIFIVFSSRIVLCVFVSVFSFFIIFLLFIVWK